MLQIKPSTTLVIAHRLATIQNADRIVAVDSSGIAEQGTHEGLVANGGPYSRLHSAQDFPWQDRKAIEQPH